MSIRLMTLMSLGLALGWFATPRAEATIMLRIDGTPETLTAGTTAGTYSFNGNVDNFIVIVNITTNSATSGPNSPILQSTDISFRNSGTTPGSIEVDVTDTSFTYPQHPSNMLVTNQIISATSFNPPTNTSPATIRFQSAADPSKTPFGTAATTAVAYPGLVQNGSFTPSAITNASFYSSTGYSLSSFLNVSNVVANGSFSVTGQTSAIATPEPATLAMALAGLPVVGFVGWRHRWKRAADLA